MNRTSLIDAELNSIAAVTDGQFPTGAYQEIARKFKVSREYVRLRSNALGYISVRQILKEGIQCRGCTEIIINPVHRKFHSKECKKKYYIEFGVKHQYVCEVCGKEFFRKYKAPRRRFCSRGCCSVGARMCVRRWRKRIDILKSLGIKVIDFKTFMKQFGLREMNARGQLSLAAKNHAIKRFRRGKYLINL